MYGHLPFQSMPSLLGVGGGPGPHPVARLGEGRSGADLTSMNATMAALNLANLSQQAQQALTISGGAEAGALRKASDPGVQTGEWKFNPTRQSDWKCSPTCRLLG